ncbi:MAG: isoamylase early set domain-containing protein [Ilumatobacteraceae bacterium]
MSAHISKGVPMLTCSNSRSRGVVKVTFSLPAAQFHQPVSVLGDFNGWDPMAHPLKKRRNGTLSATVEVAPGQSLRFKYLAGDGNWFCDPAADSVVHDEYQTVDSLLVV